MTSQLSGILAEASRRLEPIARSLPEVFRRNSAIVATTVAVLGLSSAWLRNNYLEFKALGPGGLPYNVKGWVMALVLKALSRETLSVGEYDRDADQSSWFDDPESIPERGTARPQHGFHIVPARQSDQIPSKELMQRVDEMFKRLLELNPAFLEVDKSPHEARNEGVMLKREVAQHEVAKNALREVAHIHPIDHSMHMLLAPRDCKLVIERGWGERHALSGAPKAHALPLPPPAKIPKEYIWIYAPRDERELAVVEKILLASARFMTSSRDIKL